MGHRNGGGARQASRGTPRARSSSTACLRAQRRRVLGPGKQLSRDNAIAPRRPRPRRDGVARSPGRLLVPQLRRRHPLPIAPLSTTMLERHIQPATKPRMLVEETTHAHRHLRRPSGPGESSNTTVNHRCPGGSVAASHNTSSGSPRRRTRSRPSSAVPTMTPLIAAAPSTAAAPTRLHSRCSGPPTDSPSAWPRSHGWPGRISPPRRPPRTGTQPRAHTEPSPTQPAPRHAARARC